MQGSPLDTRIESRASAIHEKLLDTAKRLSEQGMSERAIAGYFSTIEYLDRLVQSALDTEPPREREAFVVEIQSGVRALVHGLIMGDSEMRHEEQRTIASSPGRLAKEIVGALKRANGYDRKGPEESAYTREYQL